MTQKARLKWRCRRGTRELDLLLEGFLEARYQKLSPASRDRFERLLDCPNQDLMAWFMDGQTPPDEDLAGIVQQIRDQMMPNR